MPVYPTHRHEYAVTGPETEQCLWCGYHRYRNVPGSEVLDAALASGFPRKTASK